MHFGDDEKPARKAALQKLMSVLGGETSKKLSGLKKPPFGEGSAAEESAESPEMEASEDAEPSDEEKAKITELYERYCK